MTPFPGESVALFDAVNVGPDDWSLPLDIMHRDGSRSLGSGDEWRAWVAPGDTNYLEPGTPDVVVSWVVEVASGTVTLTAAEGFDPEYGDPATAPTTGLGSHTATGPGTLVIPSTFTATDVLTADDALMLALTATAGTAVVQQVKLRVWPSSGVLGGWGDIRPGFNDDPQNAVYQYANATIEGVAVTDDPETAWVAAHSAFEAQVGPVSADQPRTFTSTPTGSLFARQQVGSTGADVWEASTTLFTDLILVRGVDWRLAYPMAPGLVEGVDWVVPPNEVPADTLQLVQRTEDGSTGWLNAVVTVTATGDMPGDVTAASVGGEFAPVGGVLSLPLDHSGTSGAVALDESGRDIAVTLSHTVALGVAAAYGVSRLDVLGYSFGVGGSPVQAFAIVPPYRTWLPTLVAAVEPLRLMQRGDGLGMGSGRVFGPGTRQASSRVFGSL